MSIVIKIPIDKNRIIFLKDSTSSFSNIVYNHKLSLPSFSKGLLYWKPAAGAEISTSLNERWIQKNELIQWGASLG
jgi:hypothetical protein